MLQEGYKTRNIRLKAYHTTDILQTQNQGEQTEGLKLDTRKGRDLRRSCQASDLQEQSKTVTLYKRFSTPGTYCEWFNASKSGDTP